MVDKKMLSHEAVMINPNASFSENLAYVLLISPLTKSFIYFSVGRIDCCNADTCKQNFFGKILLNNLRVTHCNFLPGD